MSATSSVIITLFILLLIGCGLLCFSNLSRLHLKRHIIPLIIVLLLSLYCFYPINKSYFMGLEYEDAYIFSASARFMQEDRGSYPDPLRTRSCVMGSLSNCEMSAVYGGHFLAVPSLALASHRLLGYSPYTICIINGTAAILSILVLYALCFQITGDIALSFISSLIYAVVPIMTVFHTSALGETYSSLIVLIYGFCFIALFIKSEQLRSLFAIACWIVLFLSFVLALLTKRENLIIVAMPLFALLSLPSKRLRDNKGLIAWAIASLVIAVAVSVAFQIVQAEANEATDIGSATFSLGYFLALLPLFTKSFITVRWFMAASLFVVLGLWALRHRFYIRSGYSIIAGLFLAYLLIYTFHYRSYYFVNYGMVSPFETLRYITNFFPWFALLAGIGVYEAARLLGLAHETSLKHKIVIVALFVVMWGMPSIWMARKLRAEFQQIEWENRIAPMAESLNIIDSKNDYLVTDLSVLFQVFGDNKLKLIDSYSIGALIPEDMVLQRLRGIKSAWLLQRAEDNSIDMKRFPEFSSFLSKCDLSDCEKLPAHYSLCRISVK